MRVCQFRHDGKWITMQRQPEKPPVRKINTTILQASHSLSNGQDEHFRGTDKILDSFSPRLSASVVKNAFEADFTPASPSSKSSHSAPSTPGMPSPPPPHTSGTSHHPLPALYRPHPNDST